MSKHDDVPPIGCENIKHEFNNKSKLYVLAAFAGARKNDFKLKAIIQATNSVLKYPNPAITESDVKDITFGNNPWYIMKLHKKEQAAILTNAGFVYTANVVKPQTLSAFSLKVSRGDGDVTSEYIQEVIQTTWPQAK
ncbi:hypothetical protein AGABI1DRAFT_132994 [Agaricus bisporus var. burnettii JB137-S8]|uniref:Uncharacterized protein n=1 Tax=Agaricus bisporus var. burnettii (strain JB137-S8 / ATCC MYA-4627 / FGSC 10392) TaxID=597362 RepID=K5WVV4_AGABU|nr:uncharacterized protein AGABI1DRAFT_132994 [Agaricus bisporus var. burnettii JB137-S8]EKM74682.1 hypothetical protein AGABI1DRAFT_132994 [Agaricus bisporus var. burnettii JB137-S8]